MSPVIEMARPARLPAQSAENLDSSVEKSTKPIERRHIRHFGKVAVKSVGNILRENKELNRLAYTDKLTGLCNSNYWENFKEKFEKSKVTCDTAIIAFDANHLKEVNDSFDHSAGDRLLQNIAQFLKANFRSDDNIVHIDGDHANQNEDIIHPDNEKFTKTSKVVRRGGDEFYVICHNLSGDPEFEKKLNNRVQAILEKRSLMEKNEGITSLEETISLSFGVAVYHAEQQDANIIDTINEADRKCNENKIVTDHGRRPTTNVVNLEKYRH